ncbi:MAG: hypothetical protein PHZ00_00760 [Candidatus Peribacteraceae bacterium]|nr:hypothetical protein [Candidatus Peribacteraceae bacterium]
MKRVFQVVEAGGKNLKSVRTYCWTGKQTQSEERIVWTTRRRTMNEENAIRCRKSLRQKMVRKKLTPKTFELPEPLIAKLQGAGKWYPEDFQRRLSVFQR